MNIYKPEVFQGSFKKDRYFEGWYFKHVSKDLQHVISVIPGISMNKTDAHSFIQVIDGISGETSYFRYEAGDFEASRSKLHIRVGESSFSKDGIELNINQEKQINGKIEYSDFTPYPKKLLSPGIMGWYSFVPFMECKHGIVSVQHHLDGSLEIDGKKINFDDGNGYSEKDWGTSFPESWIWVHCNNFEKSNASLTFSVAKIPWLGSFFVGLIAFLYYDERFYLFSTYNKSRVKHLDYKNNRLLVELESKEYNLHIRVTQNRSGDLKAPAMGEMSRVIKESIDSDVEISLQDPKGNVIYEDRGTRAGMEIIEKILGYF